MPTSQFNRAVKAKRQPGSSFKPFVYAAALEKGLTPDSVFNDAPIRIGNWTPENYEKKYNGEVTLATALAKSLNTVAAQLVMYDGPDQVIKLAHRLGIESELQPNASIALGTSEVSLMELTAAYAAFMNGGYKATPHVIRRVTTADGKVLYENTYDNPPRVLSEQIVAEHEHDDDGRHQRRHRQERQASRLAGSRQDRHHPEFARCAVRRLHQQSDDRRLVRQ